MPREMCLTCMRPRASCLCPAAPPMPTRTRIVLLMHPMEHRRTKCTTGRIACLNLANSEIIPGVRFDENARFRALVDDPRNFAVLLYPGKDALRVRPGGLDDPALDGQGLGAPTLGAPTLGGQSLAGRRLVVFLVDATWHCARSMVRQSPALQLLTRIAIEPAAPSRFTIKRQPAPWCLSTIEAIHELLLALEAAGLDAYPDKERLLGAFQTMQDFQIRQTARAAVRTTHRVRGARETLDQPREASPEAPAEGSP